MSFVQREKTINEGNKKDTSSAKSTFGLPFSNKIWTICSYPFFTAIKRGVAPYFTLKNEKMKKWKNEKMKKWKKWKKWKNKMKKKNINVE